MVDLSAAVLIRAGSGLLWLALGVAVLVLARDVRGRLLGVIAAGFGAHFVLFNLTVFDPSTQLISVTVSPAIYGSAGAAALVLAWTLAVSHRTRLGVIILGAFAIGAALLRLLTARLNPAYTPEAAAVYLYTDSLFVFGQCALVALVFGMAGLHRHRPGSGPALAALAFGIYLGFASANGVMGRFVTVGVAELESDLALYFYWGSSLLLVVAAAVAWLAAIQPPEGRRARNVALLLLLSATLGAGLAAIDGFDPRQVSVGVLRTLGAAFFATALFRHGLFDLPLPRLVASKGAVAAGALAVLFIVAQVAQNFLSAEYGLLTGGVIAGAFLFAAQPLQRMAERLTGGSVEGGTAPNASARAEESYRAALRFALKDARLSPEEERSLVVLAHDLGITPRRAYELRDEVAGERPTGGAR